jgi:CheY-like chemotaxis protein
VQSDRDEAAAAADQQRRCRHRILVVDDNPDTAKLLSMALRRDGHHIELAFGGLEAVEAAGRFRPEVVLLDLAMPGMDGFEAARRLRFLPGLSRVRLVALTGHSDPMSRAAATAAGFDHYLVKPPALSDLFAVLTDRTAAAAACI